MGRIIEIPFSHNLVEFVAEKLLEGNDGHDLSASCVVFPHKRPVFYLRRVLAERLRSAFFPPQMFSMDEFVAFLHAKTTPGRTPIKRLDNVYLLFKIVTEIADGPWQKAAATFNQFLPWGLKLARVIDELDTELVRNERLKGLEQIEHWEPEISVKAGHLMHHLSCIRQKFHAMLDEHRLTTRGVDYANSAKSVEEGNGTSFSAIYFAGLFAMTKAEKVVIRHFLKTPQGNLVRQNDGTEWEPFQEMDIWAKKQSGVEVLRVEGNPQSQHSRTAMPEVSLHSAFNTHSEVVGLKDIILKEKALYEKTAIILPEPEPLIPLLSEVMTSLSADYNISMGYPASRTPVYALLELFMNLQQNKRGNAYYLKDYLSLLMHPYIKNIRHAAVEPAHTRILIHSVEMVLSSQGKTFLALDEIEKMQGIFEQAARMVEGQTSTRSFEDVLLLIHKTFIRKIAAVKTLANLASCFEEILSFILRNSSAAHYPFSGEFFHSFFQLLDNIKNSLLRDEAFSNPRDLFGLFRQITQGVRISFQGIPLKGLQILGLLETRCLSFERVFLLDANEGILPSVMSEDSLLPLSLRGALELPLHYHEEEIYRYHFHHLISSGQKVHIFYRQTEDKFRSRFIEKLIWEKEKSAHRLGLLEASPIELNVSLSPTAQFKIDKGPEILALLSKMRFSVSGLNSYLKCPAKFYFTYVLGLREKERISEELDLTKAGEVLHEVLKQLYQPFEGRGTLGEAEYAALEKSLPQVMDKVFSDKLGESRGENYLLKKMALIRLKRYLESERDNSVGKINVVSVEKSLSCSLQIKDGTMVQLEGRTDRIDRYGKEYMIIDYKSGRDLKKHSFGTFGRVFNSRDEMKENIKSLQLPLYTLIYQRAEHLPHEEVNAKLISLRTAKEALLFNAEIDRKEFLENVFLPTIKNLICEIFNPDLPFISDDSHEEVCQYCPFPTFCHKSTKTKNVT